MTSPPSTRTWTTPSLKSTTSSRKSRTTTARNSPSSSARRTRPATHATVPRPTSAPASPASIPWPSPTVPRPPDPNAGAPCPPTAPPHPDARRAPVLHTPACPAGAIEIITTWTPATPPSRHHTRLALDHNPLFGFLVHYALHVPIRLHPRTVARARNRGRLLHHAQDGTCYSTVGAAARLPHPPAREPPPDPLTPPPAAVDRPLHRGRLPRHAQAGTSSITAGAAARLPHPPAREPAPDRTYDWAAVGARWHQTLNAIPLRELTEQEHACDTGRGGPPLQLQAS